MSEVSTDAAVTYAAQGDATKFKDTINDLLMGKVADALEVEKINVAQSMFADEEDVQQQDDADYEPEEEGSDEDI
jgi:predicted nuclease of restriction endonuclease-like RecB superfamily